MFEEVPEQESLDEKSAYSFEEAMVLARLWEAGKLIGGDPYAVISALLAFIDAKADL